MRTFALGLVVACTLTAPASAKVLTTVKVETYPVAGNTGEALLGAMDRNGPKQGFLARAIAQTRYSVDWKLHWLKSGEGCRLNTVEAKLSIGYRFPELKDNSSPAMARKWARFMKGVRAHEETHGRIARQMVAAAHKSVLKVAFADDPSCRKAQREVTRRVNATYAEYEARQNRFDAVEHAEGGNVDRLVNNLISRRN